MSNSIVIKIQEEYFKLIREWLTEKEKNKLLSLSYNDLRIYLVQKFESPKITTPGRTPKSEFELRFDKLLQEISRFWSANSDTLINALKDLGAYSVTLQSQGFVLAWESTCKRLGVYFDSILFVDPLHLQPPSWLEYSLNSPQRKVRKLILTERLSNMLRLDQLQSKNIDYPIIVVIPDNQATEGGGYENRTASFLAETLYNRPEVKELDEFVQLIDRLRDKENLKKNEYFINLLKLYSGKPNSLMFACIPDSEEITLVKPTELEKMPFEHQFNPAVSEFMSQKLE